MALDNKLLKTLLHDAQQELAEINERKSHLDALVSNLRRCLLNSSNGSHSTQELALQQATPKKGGYRRKVSHATNIHEIVSNSETKLKARDVLKAYRERGWKISELEQNALTSIYRSVKDRPDLLKLSNDGYILPIIQ
jgi:hypothetical protein